MSCGRASVCDVQAGPVLDSSGGAAERVLLSNVKSPCLDSRFFSFKLAARQCSCSQTQRPGEQLHFSSWFTHCILLAAKCWGWRRTGAPNLHSFCVGQRAGDRSVTVAIAHRQRATFVKFHVLWPNKDCFDPVPAAAAALPPALAHTGHHHRLSEPSNTREDWALMLAICC